MLYGAGFFLPGVSIPVLLGVVAAFATAAGVLLVLALSRGGTSFDPPSGKQ
jgi:hypothetical protein